MGLTGGDLLVPPVGTGGDTIAHLGTGAREAGTGEGSGLLTVRAARPGGLVRAVGTVRRSITLMLRLDTLTAIPTGCQACPVTLITYGRTLVTATITGPVTITLVLLPAEADLHTLPATGEPGRVSTGTLLH